MFPSKVLLQVTGSISCFKSAALASQLVKLGCEVQVVATPSALKFVGEATFEGLTGRPVQTEIFESGKMMDHIHLARWADVFLLYPASAHTINRLALGGADDLIGALGLAKEEHIPSFIAPAMNQQMWKHSSVQSSLDTLSRWGHQILNPTSGALACGETGPGRLMEPEEVIQELKRRFENRKLGRVLVTSGGTKEPIDAVRFISNMSSGKTGARIAQTFLDAGYEVTYLRASDATTPNLNHPRLNTQVFSDFKSLNDCLQKELGATDFTAVIHAAAVSDYSVAKIEGSDSVSTGKINAQGELVLRLKPNFKILSRLREYSKNKNIKVVGFKLTVGNDPEDIGRRIENLKSNSALDLIVHNDLTQISDHQHKGQIIIGDRIIPFSQKQELAQKLLSLIQNTETLLPNQSINSPEVTL